MVTSLLLWIRNKLIIALSITTVYLFVSTLPPPVSAIKISNYRLPRHIVPKNYQLLLQPNLPNNTFDGSVIIAIEVLRPTDSITLHSNNLTIISTAIKNSHGQDIRISNIVMSSYKREFVYVELTYVIGKGFYSLHLKFKGSLINGFTGLYASSLKKSGTMVASKFQPTYARQAFPCFDEPDFKATFDVTLVKPSSYIALSNMHEISKTRDKDTNTESVTFATSVPMSTYLACFVICEFDFKETEVNAKGIGKNFRLRSYAQKNEMHKIDFALDIGKRATEFFIHYYEVPFPLHKLDMIAIPDSISMGMEHWGLITYMESVFLVNQAAVSSLNKIVVATAVAHEVAHMWFGNLVTMKWWDDLWLNEGFATYMELKSLDAIEPSWNVLDRFVTSLPELLMYDAKLSSHPLVRVVDTPDQIIALFDVITYRKGATILRMLEGFIGEENFRLGVSDYLRTHEFGNTVTQDLLTSLTPYFKEVNPDSSITYIMDTWTRQMGYPVLTVTKGEEPNTYVITQRRFLLNMKAKYPNDSQFNYRWFVPITYKTNKGHNENVLWFPDTAENVKLTLEQGENWLKINNNQVGYYRVNYPLDMWQTLIQQLQAKSVQLTLSDRAHLLNDAFALADAELVPYDLALDLTTYLMVEDNYVPWEMAAGLLETLSDRLLNSLAHDDLQKYVQHLIKPLYQKQSWQTSASGVIRGLLRTKILSLATRFQHPDAESWVRALFLRYLNAKGKPGTFRIDPDLRDVVYIYGMKSASKSEWEKLWHIYLKEDDAQEQMNLRNALAAPRDTNLLRRYLMLAWEEKYVRSQDYLSVLHYIATNPSGTALVWDDVRSRWPQLVERFSLNSLALGAMIQQITKYFHTELKLAEMEAWFAQYPEAGAGEAGREHALENVRNNIAWARAHLPVVQAWLQARTNSE